MQQHKDQRTRDDESKKREWIAPEVEIMEAREAKNGPDTVFDGSQYS